MKKILNWVKKNDLTTFRYFQFCTYKRCWLRQKMNLRIWCGFRRKKVLIGTRPHTGTLTNNKTPRLILHTYIMYTRACCKHCLSSREWHVEMASHHVVNILPVVQCNQLKRSQHGPEKVVKTCEPIVGILSNAAKTQEPMRTGSEF